MLVLLLKLLSIDKRFRVLLFFYSLSKRNVRLLIFVILIRCIFVFLSGLFEFLLFLHLFFFALLHFQFLHSSRYRLVLCRSIHRMIAKLFKESIPFLRLLLLFFFSKRYRSKIILHFIFPQPRTIIMLLNPLLNLSLLYNFLPIINSLNNFISILNFNIFKHSFSV